MDNEKQPTFKCFHNVNDFEVVFYFDSLRTVGMKHLRIMRKNFDVDSYH